jgi:hypothetical protein
VFPCATAQRGTPRRQEGTKVRRAFFFEKRSKKLFHTQLYQCAYVVERAVPIGKVLWFFLSRKNALPFLTYLPARHGAEP